MTKIAAVRVRGNIKIRKEIIDTLNMLRLYNKNYCTLIENKKETIGMLEKVRDFITYGEVSEDTIKLLIEKRGEIYGGPEKDSKGKINYSRKFFEVEGKKYKKYFRLAPPIGGWERKGTKQSFNKGGALGNRKDKINDLIKKMI